MPCPTRSTGAATRSGKSSASASRRTDKKRVVRVVPLSALIFAGACTFAGISSVAQAADPTLQECVAANEKSGPLRQAGKLREARANLLKCSAPTRPGVVRDDCIGGATKLEDAIPTIVFAAQDGAGNDLATVTVTMDGQPLTDRLGGGAIEVDPGEHVFTFTTSGLPPVDKRLVIREAEKNRYERVVLGSEGAPATSQAATVRPSGLGDAGKSPPPGQSTWNSEKTIALALAGVGIVGVAVGSVFGLAAHSSWQQAQKDCGSTCSTTSTAQNEAQDAHNKATLSNVAFIAGAAALAAGVVFWVLAPSGSDAASARILPFVGPGSGGIAAMGTLP